MYKIQEVLRHPSQYRDRIRPEDRPATGEYAKTFNKFQPKKVEVNEATVEEVIRFGQYLKKSEEDIAEAIDIYKTLVTTLSMGQRNYQMQTLKTSRNNVYSPNTTQMHTTPLYKAQHLDK